MKPHIKHKRKRAQLVADRLLGIDRAEIKRQRIREREIQRISKLMDEWEKSRANNRKDDERSGKAIEG